MDKKRSLLPGNWRSLMPQILIALFCAVVTFCVYSPALDYGFIDLDDYHYITENLHLRKSGMELGKWALLDGSYAALWMPLTWFSHALDCWIWGYDPRGHHLSSVVLHAISAGICFFLFYTIISYYRLKCRETSLSDNLAITYGHPYLAAIFGALFFSLHPLRVESVAWVSERKDLLCGLMYMLSVLSYLYYLSKRDQRLKAGGWYLSSVFCFVLAAASKPMAVSLPLTLLVLDVLFERFANRNERWHVVLEKLPFATIAAGLSILTIYVNKLKSTIIPYVDISYIDRIELIIKSYAFYFEKIIYPGGLSTYYPVLMAKESLFRIENIFIVVLFVSILTVKRRTKLCIYLCLFVFVLSLFPVIGVVKVGEPIFAADRFTYIPSLAPSILLGVLPTLFNQKKYRLFGYLISIVAIVSLFLITRETLPAWKNNMSFWTKAVESPNNNSSTIFLKRGLEYYKIHKYNDALSDFNRSLKINPNRIEVYKWRGKTYAEMGLYELALRDLEHYLTKNSHDADILNTIGGVLWLTYRLEEAIEKYELALDVDPGQKLAFLNLTKIYKNKGDTDKLCSLTRKSLDKGTVNMDDVLNNGLSHCLERF